MNKTESKLFVLKVFYLVGAVVMAVGVFALTGCLIFGSSPCEALMALILGGYIMNKAKSDRSELIESEDGQ